MTPSPDDILACETPFALFGHAATERRALKRAYATLIKTYDPDSHPDVFTHIRALYEQARSGDTGAPVPEAPALRLVRDDDLPEEPSAEAPSETTPAEQLEEVMKEGDADRAIELLDAHDLDIRIASPGIWFASVAALADARTFALPAHTMQSWLDAIEQAPDGVPEPLLERIELLTTTGLAYQAARQDPQISPQLLEFLQHWGKGPMDVAGAFLELGEAMPDPEAAWEAHQALKEGHPALWFPYTLMANLVTREVDTFDESTSACLQGPPVQSWALGPTSTLRLLHRLAVTSRLSGTILMVLCALFYVVADAGFAGVCFMAATAYALVGAVALPMVDGRIERANQRIVHQMVSGARAEVRFPHEALDLVLAARSDAPQDRLLLWQKDPTTLMRVLTPAHLERIGARIAAEQAALHPSTEQAE